ncbi:MAG: hypothetical protein ACOYM2_01315 [Rectinemataceae bacterium]
MMPGLPAASRWRHSNGLRWIEPQRSQADLAPLYLIDAQISYDRALLYAEILASMDSTQKAYFESFYMKDAPAIGHEGYAIDTQITATTGAALSDASKGYVTEAQAKLLELRTSIMAGKCSTALPSTLPSARPPISIPRRSRT